MRQYSPITPCPASVATSRTLRLAHAHHPNWGHITIPLTSLTVKLVVVIVEEIFIYTFIASTSPSCSSNLCPAHGLLTAFRGREPTEGATADATTHENEQQSTCDASVLRILGKQRCCGSDEPLLTEGDDRIHRVSRRWSKLRRHWCCMLSRGG